MDAVLSSPGQPGGWFLSLRGQRKEPKKGRPKRFGPAGYPAMLGKPGGCGTCARQKQRRGERFGQSSPTSPDLPALLGESQGGARNGRVWEWQRHRKVATPLLECAFLSAGTARFRFSPVSRRETQMRRGMSARTVWALASFLLLTSASSAAARRIEYRRVTREKRAVNRGALSFGYFRLGEQTKVTSRRAAPGEFGMSVELQT